MGALLSHLQFYDVPCVSVASAAFHLMKAGVEAFKVSLALFVKHMKTGHVLAVKWPLWAFSNISIPIICRLKSMCAPLLMWAGRLPKRKSRHHIMQHLLPPAPLHALLLPLAGSGAGAKYSRNDPRLLNIPPAMIPGNTETNTLMCVMQVRSANR